MPILPSSNMAVDNNNHRKHQHKNDNVRIRVMECRIIMDNNKLVVVSVADMVVLVIVVIPVQEVVAARDIMEEEEVQVQRVPLRLIIKVHPHENKWISIPLNKNNEKANGRVPVKVLV